MNLVDLIKEQLSREVLGKLGTELGESHEKTSSAVNSVIPAILAAFLKMVTGAGGAEKLDKTIAKSNLPSPGDLGGMLAGNSAGLIKIGAAILPMLLNKNAMAIVLKIVGKLGGLSLEATKKLLGFLLPLVLSSLSSQSGGKGAQGLATLLTEQKDNITSALPEGFSLDELPNLAETSKGGSKWLLPLAALFAVAAIAFYYISGLEKPPEEGGMSMPGNVPIDSESLDKTYSGFFSGITKSLESVKDAATAEAALKELGEATVKSELLKSQLNEIPAKLKGTVIELIKKENAKLKELAPKVLELPGVSEKLKPVLDDLMKRIDDFVHE